jgi:hypothetical protein
MPASSSRKQREEDEMTPALIGLFFAVFAALAPRRRKAKEQTIHGLNVPILPPDHERVQSRGGAENAHQSK